MLLTFFLFSFQTRGLLLLYGSKSYLMLYVARAASTIKILMSYERVCAFLIYKINEVILLHLKQP